MKNFMKDLIEELNYDEIYNRFFFKTEGESYSDNQIDMINDVLNFMTNDEINGFIDYLEHHYFVEAYDDVEYMRNVIFYREKEEEEVL